MGGCGTTPRVAIRPCANRSSWPTSAWPIGSPPGTAQARGTAPEDLTQTARAALVTAVDRYDPGKARAGGFVPFAVACVVGELKRSLRDSSWRVHVPRRLKDQALQVCKAVDQLEQELGRSSTVGEVAGRVQLTEEDVLEASEVAYSRLEVSLDCPHGDDHELCRRYSAARSGVPGRSSRCCRSRTLPFSRALPSPR
jgi:RNA polymerase sigma-B factor